MKIVQPLKHQAYILASEGSFSVNGKPLNKGDGMAASDVKSLTIEANGDAEVLVIDVPPFEI